MPEDLDVFFGDELGAVDVVIDATTVSGYLDMPDELVGNGLVLSTEYSLTVKTSDVSGLAAGDEIEVDGDDYEVRDVRKIDDGKLSRVALAKV